MRKLISKLLVVLATVIISVSAGAQTFAPWNHPGGTIIGAGGDTITSIVILNDSTISIVVNDTTYNFTTSAGTVTSVGLALPAQFTVSGSPVTSSGTLTGIWASAAQNYIFAGPAAGGVGIPAFRVLDVADMPSQTSAEFNTQNSDGNFVFIADTAGMLTTYINKADTAGMLVTYITKGDTAAMLLTYINKADTATMLTNYAELSEALLRTDTAAMLANYAELSEALLRTDTAALLANYAELSEALLRADTAAMLSTYAELSEALLRADTAAMLSTYAELSEALLRTDTAAMLANYAELSEALLRADTAVMLATYITRGDTATMLATYAKIIHTEHGGGLYAGVHPSGSSNRILDSIYLSATDTALYINGGIRIPISTSAGGSGGGGASAFLELDDTPGNYTDDAYKLMRVNAAEDAAEFSDTLDAYVNEADTAAMLSNYAELSEALLRIDTAALLTNYAERSEALLRVDTATMLTTYITRGDTAAMLVNYAELSEALLRTDTAAMLANYAELSEALLRTDTAAMLANYAELSEALLRADTAAMLTTYITRGDTAAMLDPYEFVGHTEHASGLYIGVHPSGTDNVLIDSIVVAADDTALYVGGGTRIPISASGGGGGGGGASSFTELSDVPANYTDASGFFTRPNVAENALEFVRSLEYDTTLWHFSNNGNDSYDGHSQETAKKTISELNSLMADSLEAGDQILFQCGGTWTGSTITMGTAGVSGNNITISSYGTGVKPIIENNSAHPIVVNAANRGYWTIDGLDIRSTYEDASMGDRAYGILADYWPGGNLGAIPGWIIQNCNFEVGGIFFSGPNTLISNNVFDGTSGNGTANNAAIYLRYVNAREAVIEYNTINDYYGRGIWIMRGADSVIIRYNTVTNIHYDGDAAHGINNDGYDIENDSMMVYGNIVGNCEYIGINAEDGFNFEYYDNYIYNCGWFGISHYMYTPHLGEITNANIHHNTIYNCRDGFMSYDAAGYIFANNTT